MAGCLGHASAIVPHQTACGRWWTPGTCQQREVRWCRVPHPQQHISLAALLTADSPASMVKGSALTLYPLTTAHIVGPIVHSGIRTTTVLRSTVVGSSKNALSQDYSRPVFTTCL